MATLKVGGFAPGVNVSLFTEKNVSAARALGEAPVSTPVVGATAADASGVVTFTNAAVLAGIAYMAYGVRRIGGAGYVAALLSTTKGWPS